MYTTGAGLSKAFSDRLGQKNDRTAQPLPQPARSAKIPRRVLGISDNDPSVPWAQVSGAGFSLQEGLQDLGGG